MTKPLSKAEKARRKRRRAIQRAQGVKKYGLRAYKALKAAGVFRDG